MVDWYNDSIHKCPRCGLIFKVYATVEPDINFCPDCGSSIGDEEDLTDEEMAEFEG